MGSDRVTAAKRKMDDLLPVVIIAGPTASGKTGLAIEVAERFGGDIVNADSMQVYDRLEILTARPSAAEMARVPHRLFGVLGPGERCSVGRWLRMAEAEIAEIRAAGRLPVLCGGTGLYLKALTQGLAAVPAVPDAVVDALRTRYAEIGGEAFRAELAAVDPVAAGRLPGTDGQRLIRALAVHRASGRTLTDWQAEQSQEPGITGRFATVLLLPPRDELYQLIDARFEAMLVAGALAEAQAFQRLGVDPALPAAKAVGLSELIRHLNGEIDLTAAVEAAKRATRNLAKRQETWFLRQIQSDLEIFEKFSERNLDKIFAFIRRFVLTPRN